MYTLYIDKAEDFICEVDVKNASLRDSIARLIIESGTGIDFVFNGKIENGKCIVPIKKLKGLLDENAKGNIHLEIIVEDTYFTPWKSEFNADEHTSVKVRVDENKQVSSKPIVEVKVLSKNADTESKKGINMYIPLKEISELCHQFNINKNNLKNKKEDFKQLVSEYFSSNPEFRSNKKTILNGLAHFL